MVEVGSLEAVASYMHAPSGTWTDPAVVHQLVVRNFKFMYTYHFAKDLANHPFSMSFIVEE